MSFNNLNLCPVNSIQSKYVCTTVSDRYFEFVSEFSEIQMLLLQVNQGIH